MKTILPLLATFLLPASAAADTPIHDPQIISEINRVHENFQAMNPDERMFIQMFNATNADVPQGIKNDINTASLASAYISECKGRQSVAAERIARSAVLSIEDGFKQYPPWHREKIIAAYYFDIKVMMNAADTHPETQCLKWTRDLEGNH